MAIDPIYAVTKYVSNLEKEKTVPVDNPISNSPQFDIEFKLNKNGQMSLF